MRRLSLATFVFVAVVAVGLGAPFPVAAEAGEVASLLLSLAAGTEGERQRAAGRLFHMGRADLGVAGLASQLGHADPAVRSQAARLLGMLRSSDAVTPLVAALADPDWAVRRDVVDSLGQIAQWRGAATQVAERLSDPHPSVRGAAARALSELRGPRADVALARALTREEDPTVVLHLVEALGTISSRRSRQALDSVLSHEVESVRLLAAIHGVEAGSPPAARLLVERLSSDSARIRTEAAQSLGRATGSSAEHARPALSALLVDVDPSVQLAAAESLATLGDGRGIRHLAALARGTAPPAVRARARTALDRFARASSP